METAEMLLAIEEIKQLKARYFRCVDMKEWDEFAQVFAPDANLEVSLTGVDADLQIVRGRAAIAEFVRSNAGPIVSSHLGHMPEINVASETSASGIWAMSDVAWWSDGDVEHSMAGYGHYTETYIKIEGVWRIARTRLSRTHVEFK